MGLGGIAGFGAISSLGSLAKGFGAGADEAMAPKVDLNSASFKEIVGLGVSEETAHDIMAERPFQSLNNLMGALDIPKTDLAKLQRGAAVRSATSALKSSQDAYQKPEGLVNPGEVLASFQGTDAPRAACAPEGGDGAVATEEGGTTTTADGERKAPDLKIPTKIHG